MYNQEPTVMNFLKSTAAKGRSSAANTNRKNESQFDHTDNDHINDNMFTSFQPEPPKLNDQTPIKLLNMNLSNYTSQNNSYAYTHFDTRQSPKLIDTTNNYSFFNSTHNSQQTNILDNNSFKTTSHFNNPELTNKQTFSFTKDKSDQSSSFSSAKVESTELL